MTKRASSMETPSTSTATHLVVFVHGLLGSESDFANFATLFGQFFDPEELVTHVATANTTSFTRLFQTYDGIDMGAARLADEIEGLARGLPRVVTRFSIIGHSLGGLYARYCIGILHARGFFEHIEPMNFITLATPHLGIRRPRRGGFNFFVNNIAPKLFDRTGQQFALCDEASDLALELARPARPSPHYQPTFAAQEIDGVLLARVPSAETNSEPAVLASGEDREFEVYSCHLATHRLRLYRHDVLAPEVEHHDDQDCVLDVDLMEARASIILPVVVEDKKGNGNGSGSGRALEGSFWDIEVRGLQGASQEKQSSRLLCVLRFPQAELENQWRWLVAFSNNACGVACMPRAPHSRLAQATPMPRPPLLYCLTQGQFIQALLRFKARTVYSSVYLDLQVPYSCGAIRAFNPYRSDNVDATTSPYYRHITVRSLWSAPLLRDTLPEDARLRALTRRSSSARGYLVKALAERPRKHRSRRSFSLSLSSRIEKRTSDCDSAGSLDEDTTQSASPEKPPLDDRASFVEATTKSSRPTWLLSSTSSLSSSSSLFSTASMTSTGDATSRIPPFTDGTMLLDHIHEAFSTDDRRDLLRAMLLSLQSVGWRRIDVMFDNVMAHEKIIAKRANPAKPLSDGLDIVHHVMDTFLI